MVHGSEIDTKAHHLFQSNEMDVCINEECPAFIGISTTDSSPVSSSTIFNCDLDERGVDSKSEYLMFEWDINGICEPKSEVNQCDRIMAAPNLKHHRLALSRVVQKETYKEIMAPQVYEGVNSKPWCEEVHKVLGNIIFIIWSWFYKDSMKEKEEDFGGYEFFEMEIHINSSQAAGDENEVQQALISLMQPVNQGFLEMDKSNSYDKFVKAMLMGSISEEACSFSSKFWSDLGYDFRKRYKQLHILLNVLLDVPPLVLTTPATNISDFHDKREEWMELEAKKIDELHVSPKGNIHECSVQVESTNSSSLRMGDGHMHSSSRHSHLVHDSKKQYFLLSSEMEDIWVEEPQRYMVSISPIRKAFQGAKIFMLADSDFKMDNSTLICVQDIENQVFSVVDSQLNLEVNNEEIHTQDGYIFSFQLLNEFYIIQCQLVKQTLRGMLGYIIWGWYYKDMEVSFID